MVEVKQVVGPNPHTEGPHWSVEERALYFIDINDHSVHRYHPDSKSHKKLKLDDTCNVIIPVKGKSGKFILGYGKTISILDWNHETGEKNIKKIFSVENGKNNRFNDGKADVKGRLWIGTMSKKLLQDEGALYRVSLNGELETVLESVSISNGITWSLDNRLMYFIDSSTKKVDVFDYDVETGNASGRRTFFDFVDHNIEGIPDGMTIDRDGNLWVAVCFGGRVLKISEAGELLYELIIPADLVSSVSWGGENLETLFVTTMYDELDASIVAKTPLAGSVFAVSGLGTGGIAGNEVSSYFDQ